MGLEEDIKSKLKEFRAENNRTGIFNNETSIRSLEKKGVDKLNSKEKDRYESSLRSRELYKEDPYYKNKEYLKK